MIRHCYPYLKVLIGCISSRRPFSFGRRVDTPELLVAIGKLGNSIVICEERNEGSTTRFNNKGLQGVT